MYNIYKAFLRPPTSVSSGVAVRLSEDKSAFSENSMKDSVNKTFQSKQQGNLSKVEPSLRSLHWKSQVPVKHTDWLTDMTWQWLKQKETDWLDKHCKPPLLKSNPHPSSCAWLRVSRQNLNVWNLTRWLKPIHFTVWMVKDFDWDLDLPTHTPRQWKGSIQCPESNVNVESWSSFGCICQIRPG